MPVLADGAVFVLPVVALVVTVVGGAVVVSLVGLAVWLRSLGRRFR
ncbi:hypothetical protein [Streptomyces chromofuscus]|nr:hypothetical protein [Streptomyces chromofuscus]GGT15499.1 hypothetical protein GCM10010254_40060 [Streptomyces chromofuscus]